MRERPIPYLIELALQFRWVKTFLYYYNAILYSRCFLSSFIALLIFALCYLYPLRTGAYSLQLFNFQYDTINISQALINPTYVRLLLVTAFLSIPPAVQLVLDSWKLFSRDAQDQIEFFGFTLVVVASAGPNTFLFFMLDGIQDAHKVTDQMVYLWMALSRIQLVTLNLGMLSQLFGHRAKYANNDSLSFLRFNIEKRTVNIMILLMIYGICFVLNGRNVKWSLLNLIGILAWLLALLLIALMLFRVLYSLTIQAFNQKQFRTHHHVSDFMFSLGFLSFMVIQTAFTVYASESHFSVHSVVRFLISTLATEIFLLVIVIVIPGMKNRRLAEIKHEQLQTRLNLIRYVSHEMRTPLNTVTMGMNILKGEIIEVSGLSNAGLETRSRSPGSTINGDEPLESNRKLSSDEHGGIMHIEKSASGFFFDKSKNRQKFIDMLDTVNQVTESTSVAVATLDDLLTFDKIDEKKLVIEVEELNPWKLLLDTSKPFSINASLKNINFRVILADSPEFLRVECIKGDAFKLAQVIRNLLSNAIKFTPENGTVDVSLKLWESVERGRNVRFSVKDTGAGISKQNMKKLFGQYVQFNAGQLQKGKGSGLGLWITKSIVEMHGGVIGANSEGEGHGTEFYFDVPLKLLSRPNRSNRIRSSLRVKASPSQQPSPLPLSALSGEVSRTTSKDDRIAISNTVAILEEGFGSVNHLSAISEGKGSDFEHPSQAVIGPKLDSPIRIPLILVGWFEILLKFFTFSRSSKIHICSESQNPSELNSSGKSYDGEKSGSRKRSSSSHQNLKGAMNTFLNYPVKLLNRKFTRDWSKGEDEQGYPNDPFDLERGQNGRQDEEAEKNDDLSDDDIPDNYVVRLNSQLGAESMKYFKNREEEDLFPVNQSLFDYEGKVPYSKFEKANTNTKNVESSTSPEANLMKKRQLLFSDPSDRLTPLTPTITKLIVARGSADFEKTQPESVDSRRSTGIGENDLIPDSKKNKLIKTAWEQGLEILLVDDADSNRKMCRRILATNGHKVSEAKDGLDCLKIYEDAKTFGRRFDLILMDDNMPNLLGYETAKKLRERGYEGVLIGVTGDVYPENIHRFVSNGANDVLGKPLNLTKLKEKYVLYTKLLDS